jgi:hypothetical protein
MLETINNAIKIVKEIQENSRDALKSLNAMETALKKGNFEKIGASIENDEFANLFKTLNLLNILSELKSRYGNYISGLRMDFDKKFLLICRELNMNGVKGDSMSEFRIQGILSLKINFQKRFAEIKTFARSKRIKSMDPTIIAHELKKELVRLFDRPFEPKLFLNSLFSAYQKLQSESKKNVLIKDVHRILWLEKQKDIFFESSDSAKMISYPLDEFSIDLGKLIQSGVQSLDNGYICRISLGSGGINIYRTDGDFNAYKFLEFSKGGENV